MRTKLATVVAVTAMLAVAVPLMAHHSWTVEYDGNKPVKIQGVVSKVEWTNPHTHIYVDAKDAQGNVTTWNFEMASTLSLERGGWSRKTLPIGTTVTVGGFGGRAETTRAIANSIVTADGKSLFVAAPGQ
jgi:hypothetical protein